MERRPATDVFHDWALRGKDEGMERGHALSVGEMIDFISVKSEQSGTNFSAVDVGCGNGWVVRIWPIISSVNKQLVSMVQQP